LEGQYALPEFEYLASNKWVFTEKVDGTNIRVNWDGEHVLFGGRTDKAQLPTFLFSKLQEMFPVEKFVQLFPDTPMTLYGEGYGAKIQKGGGNYIPDGVSFIVFDIRVGDWWLKLIDVADIAGKLGIKHVPVYGVGSLKDGIELVRGGLQSLLGTHTAEGLVMRPVVDLLTRRGSRIITKIKHKDFVR
jgi:ATP-dependent RNA circularization protein (DNA/RNA ligase family)